MQQTDMLRGTPLQHGVAVLLLLAAVALPSLQAAAPPSFSRGSPVWVADLAAPGPLAFSPDGRTIATSSLLPSEGVLLWELCSQQVRAVLAGHADDYYSLVSPAFTPDGRSLLAAVQGPDARIWIWDISKLGVVAKLAKDRSVYGMSLSPHGRQVAFVDDRSVSTWSTRLRKTTVCIKTSTNPYCCLAYRSDGKSIVAGTTDSLVRLLRANDLKVLSTFRGHRDSVIQVAVSPGGELIASASDRYQVGTVCIWQADQGKLVDRWKRFGGPTYLQFTPCLLVVACDTTKFPGQYKAEIRFWDIACRRERTEMLIHSRGVSGMALSPIGDLLAVADSHGLTRVYRLGDPLRASLPKPARSVAPPSAAWKGGEPLWDALGSSDARKAHRAIWQLVESPRSAVTFLAGKLSPAPPMNSKRWSALISQLDAESFTQREAAERELRRLGDVTEDELRRVARSNPSHEVRQRANRLLNKLERPIRDPDRLREVRAVECLELIGTKEARELLAWLAGGAPEARLTGEARRSFDRLTKRPVSEVKEATTK